MIEFNSIVRILDDQTCITWRVSDCSEPLRPVNLGLELEAGYWQLLAPWSFSCRSRSLSRCWTLGGNWALGNRSPCSSNSSRSWSGSCHLRLWKETSLCRDLRVKGRRLKAGGSSGNVVALEDSEAILARGVLHSDRLAVVVDVAVLADPLTVGGDLFLEMVPSSCAYADPNLPSPALNRCSFRILALLLFWN